MWLLIPSVSHLEGAEGRCWDLEVMEKTGRQRPGCGVKRLICPFSLAPFGPTSAPLESSLASRERTREFRLQRAPSEEMLPKFSACK